MYAHFHDLSLWLKENESLSGWAQFAGAMLALIVTYFTALAPLWRQQRADRNKADREAAALGSRAIRAYEKHVGFTKILFEAGPRIGRAHLFWLTDSIDLLERVPFDAIPPDKLDRYMDLLHYLRSTLSEFDGIDLGWDDPDATEEQTNFFRGFILEGYVLRNRQFEVAVRAIVD